MRKKMRTAWMVCMFLVPLMVLGQSRQITGKVVDEKGNPIPYASVTLKGTYKGSTADAAGLFNLTTENNSKALIVSATGFQTKEISLGNISQYSVVLTAGEPTLSEVVVSGAFGMRQRKKTLGYNVQEVGAGELSKGKENSFVNALQGKVNGVNIVSSGGAPGTGADIVIRGISSLNPGANNQPLIIIDGMPVDNSTNTGSLMPSTNGNGNQAGSRDQFGIPNRGLDINPDDIESISVLKGAGATALYGLSAANGAIIITTKKGSSGKMSVSFGSSAAIDFLTKYPEIQTKYREGSNGRIAINTNGTFGTPFQSFGPLRQPNEPVYYNFRDAFENGNRFNNSLTIQGGNAKTTYYSSVSALNQDGMIASTGFDRYTFKLAGSSQVSDKLNVTASATLTSSKTVSPSAGDKGIMTALVYHTTTVDVRDYINPDGTMKVYSPGIIDNPIYVAKYSQLTSNLFRFLGNMGFTYNILPRLKLEYKIGGDFYGDDRTRIVPGQLYPGAPLLDLAGAGVNGFITENRISHRDITSNAFLSWQNEVGDDFEYTVMVGNTLQSTYTDLISARGEGFALPNFYDLSNTANLFNFRNTSRRKYAGIFGNIKFGYKNALFLEVSGRNDWSSTLPKANNSFFYPAASLSYLFTDLHNISGSFLNYGKLRFSYAQVGKDAPLYANGPYYNSATGFPFDGIPGSRRSSVYADPNLVPEMQRSLELGTELHFLNDRVNLDVSVYQSKNENQILSVPISYNSGYSSLLTNSGSIRNRGIEVELNTTPVKSRDFRWNLIFNWSMNRSKVLSIKEGITEVPFYNEGRIINKLVVGGSAGDLYGIAYLKDPASGKFVIENTGYHAITPTAASDWVKVGNAIPDWQGSVINTITWKGLSISALLEVKQGGDLFDVTMRNGIRNGVLKITENRYEEIIFDGITRDGKPNTTPVILDENYYRNNNLFNNIADVIIQDASWIRLRNVSLSYDIPNKLVQKSGFVKTLNLGVTASNFILHTPYVGYDPQSTAFGSGYNVYGFTGSNIPNYSSVVFSLNATF